MSGTGLTVLMIVFFSLFACWDGHWPSAIFLQCHCEREARGNPHLPIYTITKRVKSIPFTLTRAFRLVPAYQDAAYLRKNLKQEGAYV